MFVSLYGISFGKSQNDREKVQEDASLAVLYGSSIWLSCKITAEKKKQKTVGSW